MSATQELRPARKSRAGGQRVPLFCSSSTTLHPGIETIVEQVDPQVSVSLVLSSLPKAVTVGRHCATPLPWHHQAVISPGLLAVLKQTHSAVSNLPVSSQSTVCFCRTCCCRRWVYITGKGTSFHSYFPASLMLNFKVIFALL